MTTSDEYRKLIADQQLLQSELDEELELVNRLLQELRERKNNYFDLAEQARLLERQLTQELAIQLKKEEDEIPLEAILPYLDRLAEYKYNEKLFPFQREDLAFMFGRHLFKDKYHGVLNANATGLGKTAETVAFLKVLQMKEEHDQANAHQSTA